MASEVNQIAWKAQTPEPIFVCLSIPNQNKNDGRNLMIMIILSKVPYVILAKASDDDDDAVVVTNVVNIRSIRIIDHSRDLARSNRRGHTLSLFFS